MINIDNITENTWKELLDDDLKTHRFQSLAHFLKHERASGKTIYPAVENIFKALNATPMPNVKVVIIGQDPYHGDNQAHGLSFSVPIGIKPPPSLRNIFKELERDLLISPAKNGDLTKWAQQGVLLLNATLTVEKSIAGSHQGKGWEEFTDRVIDILNQKRSNLVFLLWGSYAQKKGLIIDRSRHLVLESAHPSPLSAHRGFIGCGHFSKTNEYLKQINQTEIDWRLN